MIISLHATHSTSHWLKGDDGCTGHKASSHFVAVQPHDKPEKFVNA